MSRSSSSSFIRLCSTCSPCTSIQLGFTLGEDLMDHSMEGVLLGVEGEEGFFLGL